QSSNRLVPAHAASISTTSTSRTTQSSRAGTNGPNNPRNAASSAVPIKLKTQRASREASTARIALSRPVQHDLDAQVFFALFRRLVLVERIGFAAALRRDAPGIAERARDQCPGGLGARRGKLE